MHDRFGIVDYAASLVVECIRVIEVYSSDRVYSRAAHSCGQALK